MSASPSSPKALAPHATSSSYSSSSSSASSNSKNKSLKRYLAAEYSKGLLPPQEAIKVKKSVKWGAYQEAASPSSGSKPILKVKGNPQASKKQFEEKQHIEKKYLQEMHKGAVLTQYAVFGQQRSRFFYVSEDGTELFICKNSGVTKVLGMKPVPERVILLADVEFVTFGPRTEAFGEFDWVEGHPFNCFSLIFGEHDSVDIECPDRESFMLWFLGLQSLCPMSFTNLTRGMLSWYRAYCISLIKARFSGMDLREYWHMMVAQARAEMSSKKVSNKFTNVTLFQKLKSSASNLKGPASTSAVSTGHGKVLIWDDSADSVPEKFPEFEAQV
jgi:hypothetical protein